MSLDPPMPVDPLPPADQPVPGDPPASVDQPVRAALMNDDVAPPLAPQLLVVGRIGKPQGVLGEVTVQVRTDDPDARFAVGSALPTEPDSAGPLVVAAARDQNGRLVLRFRGVDDRNAAERLRGVLLQVDAATLPPSDDPDVFHDLQLVGLTVELTGGGELGRVSEVLHLPHGDVLVVTRSGNEPVGEVLVPFVKAFVPVVDVPGGRLVVDPPEGLLGLSEPAAGS